MKTPTSPETTTINEIRTERLSRALQKMRKKSISVCAMRDTVKVNIEIIQTPEKSPIKRAFVETDRCSGSDNVEAIAYFRRRTSSVPVIREFTIQSSIIHEKGDTKFPTIVVGNSINRLVRHLLHRREKENGHPRSDKEKNQSTTPRARTMATIFDHGRVKEKPNVPVRLRSQTSVQAAPVCGNRSANHYASKSSSGVSSRCHSPMRFSTMLSLPTSEPVSPGGSPMIPENSFTVLVIGSEGVGKGDLIELFLKSDSRKVSANLESDFDELDNNYAVTLVVENEEIDLRFVEVNPEKNDLWLSLSASAHLVLYTSDDANSYRNATQVIRKLRESNEITPVFLVSNKQPCEMKRTNSTNSDDGRHLAKQKNCKFFEICTEHACSRGIDDLLITVVNQIRRHARYRLGSPRKRDPSIESTMIEIGSPFDQPNGGLGGSFFHLRTWSAGSNSSSTGSKNSPSLGVVRQKFWNRQKSKTGVDENLGTSCSNLTLTGLQKYFNFRRRGSLSLESLESQRMKKTS